MTSYPPEQIFEVNWEGPYTYSELESEEEDYPGFHASLKLYAKYQDHPLYGRGCLTYIGKAVDQHILKRLAQHDLGRDKVYVANVVSFTNWDESDRLRELDYDERSFVEDADTISAIEELLIYALWPAGNLRNKSSAKNSWGFRIFNTGHLGDLPPEVSGHYALYNAPEPDR